MDPVKRVHTVETLKDISNRSNPFSNSNYSPLAVSIPPAVSKPQPQQLLRKKVSCSYTTNSVTESKRIKLKNKGELELHKPKETPKIQPPISRQIKPPSPQPHTPTRKQLMEKLSLL